jgi:hypothetical protein
MQILQGNEDATAIKGGKLPSLSLFVGRGKAIEKQFEAPPGHFSQRELPFRREGLGPMVKLVR